MLEVGPGCGYLAMLLVMEGYPYIGTDIAQSFYLYQSHMLSHVASNLVEMVVEDGDILSLETPKPGTAVHIPWWKWVTLRPEQIKLSAGIMTSNHCLCEMHANSFAYLARVSNQILGCHPNGGTFVFDSWGYDLLHSEQTVLAKFVEHGFRLCHNDVGVSAMVLEKYAQGWPVYGGGAAPVAAPEKKTVLDTMNQMPWMKKPLVAAIKRFPRVRQALISLLLPAQPSAPVSTQVPQYKSDNPISRKLISGLDSAFAAAKIGTPDLMKFLKEHFGGTIPEHPDEAFFRIIGTLQ